jgi:hypothetical protein
MRATSGNDVTYRVKFGMLEAALTQAPQACSQPEHDVAANVAAGPRCQGDAVVLPNGCVVLINGVEVSNRSNTQVVMLCVCCRDALDMA